MKEEMLCAVLILFREATNHNNGAGYPLAHTKNCLIRVPNPPSHKRVILSQHRQLKYLLILSSLDLVNGSEMGIPPFV